MEDKAVLDKYGLFRAKVPRFTSYPPANRFELDTGRRYQADWLTTLPADKAVSLYVHIPFCRRLCYFCACRTQGTQTLAPVAAYVGTLIAEIQAVKRLLPPTIGMARLHFGGGTPTLLDTELMNRLCEAIFSTFAPSPDFEFSVEIDPTEASDSVLDTLGAWRLGRASIGVQDFEPRVQKAIGRVQSFEQTKSVVDRLRGLGVDSINFDLVYGLPFQTRESLNETLQDVLSLAPDRLALYGYAHVPHMSKRQVLIPSEDLPDTRGRFSLAELARERLMADGYSAIGIDHFGLPNDSLAKAAAEGRLRRNFQGYTDDPCRTLIGFGASAISEFAQGYVQNAVATAGYAGRIANGVLAGHRGYAMSVRDHMVSDLVQGLMCYGRIDTEALAAAHPKMADEARIICAYIATEFSDAVKVSATGLEIREDARSLTRVIASTATQDGVETGSLAI
ncbi:MAG: oxygen-independent coproporphyrinogen III oxidase [Silicimonas sp.]|jgi:oxygen-independent coproporphyrinogen-3 oxidase|nr:oxygen-independent coproporphyrinogen III oxidase [Silicimonas sp.]